jgi:RimJ/RimL family protein N-acetyltransferase
LIFIKTIREVCFFLTFTKLAAIEDICLEKLENTRRRKALSEIKKLKWPSCVEEIRRLPVYWEKETVAFLRPLTPGISEQMEPDSILMTHWRCLESKAFFTWQDYTLDQTKQWILNHYANDPFDIIFFIENTYHQPFGMASLYHIHKKDRECEFGRLLRGNSNGPEGGMTIAVKQLCRFAMDELMIDRIYLEVFANNNRAISLYRRCGFKKTDSFRVYQIPFEGGIKWIPIDTMSEIKFKKALRLEMRR